MSRDSLNAAALQGLDGIGLVGERCDIDSGSAGSRAPLIHHDRPELTACSALRADIVAA
ncbi:hypothetical protein VUN82_11055 [Micrococcaceae bacterium Sec5.1]